MKIKQYDTAKYKGRKVIVVSLNREKALIKLLPGEKEIFIMGSSQSLFTTNVNNLTIEPIPPF